MSEEAFELQASDLRWFECDGIHIAIDRTTSSVLPALGIAADSEAAVMDLIDAVLLSEQDSLLQFLDDWCKTSFNWRPWQPGKTGESISSDQQENDGSSNSSDTVVPVPLHELRGYPRLTASLTSLEGTAHRLLLAIDAESMAVMPAVPETWQSLVQLRNHVMPYRLLLQQMKLQADEIVKLVPGGLVLLPQSFESAWSANMLAGKEGSLFGSHGRISVIMEADNSRVKLLSETGGDGFVQPSEAGTKDEFQSITVELEVPMPMNELYVRSVLQSNLNLLLELPQELLGSSVVIRSLDKAGQGGVLDLSGTLMKVGAGYGVLLEQFAAQSSPPHSL